MKKFSAEEINDSRKWLTERGFPKTNVSLGEYNFDYFTMPQSLEPNLPDFVYRCTGEREDGYVIGISDSVRPNFRPYATLHEFVEFMNIGMETEGRCHKALEIELSFVPNIIHVSYIQMRERFFDNLIKYTSSKTDQFTPSDVDEFRHSLSLLRSMIRQMPPLSVSL